MIQRSDSAVEKYYELIALGVTMSRTENQELAVSAFQQSRNYWGGDISFAVATHVEQQSSLSEDSKQQVYDAWVAIVLRDDSPQQQVENLAWIGRFMPDKEKAKQAFDQALAVLEALPQKGQLGGLSRFEIVELKSGLYIHMASRKDGAFNNEARAGLEKTYQEIAAQEKSQEKMICFDRLARNLGLSDLPLEFILEQHHQILTSVLDDLRAVCAEGNGKKTRDIGIQATNVCDTLHTGLFFVGKKMTETEFENEFGDTVQEIKTLFRQHADFTYD
jgi:hypothetical protein